jgi:uncharacterized membrane protein
MGGGGHPTRESVAKMPLRTAFQSETPALTMAKRLTLSIGGATLAAFAFRNKGLRRLIYAGAAADLIRRGLRDGPDASEISAAAIATIKGDPGLIYRLWRDVEAAPKYVPHVRTVRPVDDRTSAWAVAFRDRSVAEVKVKIVSDTPGERVAWVLAPNPFCAARGETTFLASDVPLSTEIRTHVTVSHPGALPSSFTSILLRRNLNQVLRSFKQLIETGEVATIQGQSSGGRTALTALADRVVGPLISPQSTPAAAGA